MKSDKLIDKKFLSHTDCGFHLINLSSLYLFTYACHPSWRSMGRPPTFSIQLWPGQSFPVDIHPFDVCFRFSMHYALWNSSISFLFAIQNESFPHDTVWWFPQCTLYPFSESFPNFLSSWKLVCTLLLIIFDERTLSTLCRRLFMNTCTFSMTVVIALQDSALYRRTVLTFVFKIVTSILVGSYFEFRMSFNCRNAAVALSGTWNFPPLPGLLHQVWFPGQFHYIKL